LIGDRVEVVSETLGVDCGCVGEQLLTDTDRGSGS